MLFLLRFCGGVLLLGVFVCGLLSATLGGYVDHQGFATHDGDIIGPLALLSGRATFWDIPMLLGMFAAGAGMLAAGSKAAAKPTRRAAP